MKELIEEWLDYLRELSFKNSEENVEFTKSKVHAHRQYMAGFRRTSPYVHPDEWQDDPNGQS